MNIPGALLRLLNNGLKGFGFVCSVYLIAFLLWAWLV